MNNYEYVCVTPDTGHNLLLNFRGFYCSAMEIYVNISPSLYDIVKS